MGRLNTDVSEHIQSQNLPLFKAVSELRSIILSADTSLTETLKWNSLNYAVGEEDRITLRTQPPKQMQFIFHRGAKVQKQPNAKLMEDPKKRLVWKENDRAVLTLKTHAEVVTYQNDIQEFVRKWLKATSLL